MGIVSEVRLNLQKLRWCLTVRLSLPESGGKALAEEREREMCYVLHCCLKVSLCTTYLVEANKLERITCMLPLRSKELTVFTYVYALLKTVGLHHPSF